MGERELQLSHVKYLWRDDEADRLSGVDRLVYRSNKLGEDLTLTNTGGGNTSSKLIEADPLTGEPVEVLWVKGSGGDLRTAKRDGFASLYLDKVRAMKPMYLASPERGPKTPIEDVMYPMYSHCVFNLNPRACSIDTPLHTFVPHQHVDHLHPNAVIAIAASVNQERLCREIYGDDLIYVPWQRPGFDIGLMIEQLIAENPAREGRAARPSRHELVEQRRQDVLRDGARDHRSRCQLHRGARPRRAHVWRPAACRPRSRAAEARRSPRSCRSCAARSRSAKRFVGTVQDDERMLRFVNSVDGPRLAALGTSCPDHFLRTKIKPLFVDWTPGDDRRVVESGAGQRASSSIGRTTRPTTTGASGRIRRRCAIPTRRSC